MKISVYSQDFLAAVEKALQIVPARSAFPVIQNVMIEADAGKKVIILSATDMNRSVRVECDATIVESGVCLFGNEQFKILKKMGKNELTLEAENVEVPVVKLTCGKRKYDYRSADISQYPELEMNKADNMTVCAMMHEQDFLDAMIRLNKTTSINDTQKLFGYYHMNFAEARMETLDGYRIGIRELSDARIMNAEHSVMISAESLKAFKKLIGKDDNMIWFATNRKYNQVRSAGWMYMEKNPDGEFWDCNKLISMDRNAEFYIEKDAMKDAMDYTLSLPCADIKKPVIMEITDGGLNVSRVAAEGQVEDVIGVEEYYGNFERSGYDPRYLLDAINNVDTDRVKIGWTSPKAPMILSGDLYQFVVLPVNVG